MKNKQCWEVKECGREPGGENAEKCGICNAALPNEHDGINDGEHGGRFCWAVAGTLCGGEAQGEYSAKISTCLTCDFLKMVEKEQAKNFILSPQHAILLRETKKLKKK